MQGARVSTLPVRLVAAAMVLCVVALTPIRLSAQEYAARIGDVLDIVVVGEADLSRVVTVTPEGNIFLPLVGDVHVAGLTIRQIEERLMLAFKRFLKDPKILVTFRQTMTDKEFVYVLGQVTRPGPYEYRRGWTVAELLAMAGGPTTRAALRRGVILRRATAIPVDLEKLVAGDVSENRELVSGDVLVVPEISERERVLVLGEVARPGYQDLKEGDRVIDVITRAGGPTLKAAPEDIYVLRNGSALRANLETFLRDGDVSQNMLMEAGDVVHMPETMRRALVLGEVATPGPVTLNPRIPTRVLDAVTQVGGPKKGANLSAIMVVRHNGDKPTGITVNLNQVLKQGQTDQNIILKPGDVVFVPAGASIQLKDILDFLASLSGFSILSTMFGLNR